MTPRGKTSFPAKILNVNRTPAQPKKRKKITLVFDEDKRREFLGGFRKRKLERKRKAQEDLQRQLKEEKKRIKQEAKDRLKKLLSSRDVPELETLLSQKEYETEGHMVSILELNVADLAEGSSWIGENKGVNENEETEEMEDQSEESVADEDIVGMSTNNNNKPEKIPEQTKSDKQLNSRKDVKREIKHAAMKQVKRSKAFQQKQRLERDKNKKDSRKKLRAKLSQKQTKKRGNKQKTNKQESKFRKKGKH